ncbi:hypothetical protein [Rhodohalobacter halophilus]|uniref:hypothetical protein n=1 Tax=Rhodohalobacter halophilus TaxID=1812810 RepID=UPI00083FAAA2|nr:hypothetical protein [Rhodohalobacter halophilus]
MLIRWLLIGLFIYLVYKLITGPKSKKKKQTPFPFGRDQQGSNRQNKRPDFEHIEEAEFEDITDKEKTEKNS